MTKSGKIKLNTTLDRQTAKILALSSGNVGGDAHLFIAVI